MKGEGIAGPGDRKHSMSGRNTCDSALRLLHSGGEGLDEDSRFRKIHIPACHRLTPLGGS
jgi:hypothetical protein